MLCLPDFLMSHVQSHLKTSGVSLSWHEGSVDYCTCTAVLLFSQRSQALHLLQGVH